MTSLRSSFQSCCKAVRQRPLREGRGSHLAARWLGEPQSPLVGERVLDGEVVRVVEDGYEVSVLSGAICCRLEIAVAINWNSIERHWLLW